MIRSTRAMSSSAATTNETESTIQNSEWIPAGKLGPFVVDKPIPEGYLVIAKCSAMEEEYRDILRFDPPNLAFGPHNQTKEEVVHVSVLKGSNVDPKKVMSKISCTTVVEEQPNHLQSGAAAMTNPSQTKMQNSEWIPAGKLGPFKVEKPIPEGYLVVAKCSATEEDYRDILRFDPPNGLAFGPHNQTKKGVVHVSVLRGSNVDPKKVMTKISCTTVVEEQSNNHLPSGAATVNPGQFHKEQPNHLRAGAAMMNPSQFCFLLLIFLVGGYYLYLVYLLPMLNAYTKKKTKPKQAGAGYSKKHKSIEKNRRQQSQNKRSKGGSSRTNKKGGGNKKQPLRTKAPTTVSAEKEENPIELPAASTNLAITASAAIKEDDEEVRFVSSSEKLEPIVSDGNEEISGKLSTNNDRMEAILDETTKQEKLVATAASASTSEGEEKQTKSDDDLCTDSEKGNEQTIRVDSPEELSSSPTIITHEEEEILTEEEATKSNAKEEGEAEENPYENRKATKSIANEEGKLNKIPSENRSIPTMAVDPLPTIDPPTVSNSPSRPNATSIFVLSIDGMTCGGCVSVVNRVLNSFDEVESVVTDLNTGTSVLSCNVHRLNLFPILKALDDVGMEAYLQSQQSLSPPSPTLCPVREQQIKQQSLGAIGQNPCPKSSTKAAKLLSLMDELRDGSTPLRRYQCSCASEGCICSDSQVHADDKGRDVSLSDICDRLERKLGTTQLEETFRATGGTPELRDKILQLSFPCGCSSEENEKNE